MSAEGHKSQLEGILEDYESTAKAPNKGELERRAIANGLDFEKVLQREREKDYKALDASTSRVYLVKNPATWIETETGLVRPEPIFQFTLADARKYGAGSPTGKKKAGGARECF